MKTDLCVIGGGASGLVAAITAADRGLSVLVLEKLEKPAKKVAAAGNGRCNLTNALCPTADDTLDFFASLGILARKDEAGRYYPYSEDGHAVSDCLIRAAYTRGVRIATGMQVERIEACDVLSPQGTAHGRRKNGQTQRVRKENGFRITAVSVSEKKNTHRARGAEPADGANGTQGAQGTAGVDRPDDISVTNGILTVEAAQVLLATGGKAAPKFGTTGDGFLLARKLGHHINTLKPVLTGVEVEKGLFKDLAGVRAKGILRLYKKDQLAFEEEGEVQFNAWGISGICVMNATRHMDLPAGRRSPQGMEIYKLEIDLVPDMTGKELAHWFIRELHFQQSRQPANPSNGEIRAEGADGNRKTKAICALRGFVRAKLAAYITKEALLILHKMNEATNSANEIKKDDGCNEKGETDIFAEQIKTAKEISIPLTLEALLSQFLKHFIVQPAGLRGWEYAQLTRGGIPLDEINAKTGESRLVPGLYFAGEIIDEDFPCGGFNLDHAWTGGRRVGASVRQNSSGHLAGNR